MYVKHVHLIPAHDLTIARKTVLRQSAASCGGLRRNGTGRCTAAGHPFSLIFSYIERRVTTDC